MISVLAIILIMCVLFKITGFMFGIIGRIFGGLLGLIGFAILGLLAVTVLGFTLFAGPIIFVIGIIMVVLSAIKH